MLSGEGVRTGGGFHTYPETIRAFPIPDVDISETKWAQMASQIVRLVDQIQQANRAYVLARTDKDIAFYEQQIASLDHRIDSIVDEMFGLTLKDKEVADTFANR